MDFWAQHKDFVLKVSAGFALFLVALIARGMVYGDELEKAERQNTRVANELSRMRIAPIKKIRAIEDARDKLRANARAIGGQIGFVGTPEELEPLLVKRALGYVRRFQEDPDRLPDAMRVIRDAIKNNVSSGFGELRGAVATLKDEATEKNISVESGTGFEEVTDIQPEELEQYLLQLELAARVVRYCIDAGVDAIEDIRITRKAVVPIPDANPDFLREYPVRIRFRASQAAMVEVLRRLDDELPAVPERAMRIDRVDRPRDHVSVEITVLAIAVTLDDNMPFVAEEKRS